MTTDAAERLRVTDGNGGQKIYLRSNSTISVTDNPDGTLTWEIPVKGGETFSVGAMVLGSWE